MTRILRHQAMGKGSLDWLQTYYHFSFADYYNEDNIHCQKRNRKSHEVTTRGFFVLS